MIETTQQVEALRRRGDDTRRQLQVCVCMHSPAPAAPFTFHTYIGSAGRERCSNVD